MRSDLRAIISETLARQSIDWNDFDRTDLGDGLRLAIPGTVAAPTLLDPFVPNLESALREHRKSASEAATLRLRVAVHQGLVHRDGGEWAGAPMVLCARLLDAAPVRRVLTRLPAANLALIVSEAIYDSVVRHGYGLDPRTYQEVVIAEKETSASAWVHIPGYTPPFDLDVGGDEAPDTSGRGSVAKGAGPGAGPAPHAPQASGVAFHGGQTTIHGPVVGGDQWNVR